jgi:hypothetical protein
MTAVMGLQSSQSEFSRSSQTQARPKGTSASLVLLTQNFATNSKSQKSIRAALSVGIFTAGTLLGDFFQNEANAN